MSLRLLIDEDSQAKRLVELLRDAGHDVITVREADLMTKPDSLVLNYARQDGRLVLTKNSNDFNMLHRADPNHPGILVVYEYFDRSKNMNYETIVKCIANIQESGLSLTNQFISLNSWKY